LSHNIEKIIRVCISGELWCESDEPSDLTDNLSELRKRLGNFAYLKNYLSLLTDFADFVARYGYLNIAINGADEDSDFPHFDERNDSLPPQSFFDIRWTDGVLYELLQSENSDEDVSHHEWISHWDSYAKGRLIDDVELICETLARIGSDTGTDFHDSLALLPFAGRFAVDNPEDVPGTYPKSGALPPY